MKNLITIFAFLLSCSTTQVTAQFYDNATSEPAIITISMGTPILLAAHNDIDSKYLKTGDNICLYLKFPIKAQGYNVIPAGTPAYCRVNQVQKPSGNGRGGLIEIQPLYLKLNNGEALIIGGDPTHITGQEHSTDAALATEGAAATAALLHQAQEISNYETAKLNSQLQAINQSQQLTQALYVSDNAFGSQGSQPSEVTNSQTMYYVGTTVAILAPMAQLFVKGKRAVLPKGYILNAYLMQDFYASF